MSSRGRDERSASKDRDEKSSTPALAIRPDRDGFDALARDWALVPMWAELLADVSTPVGLFPAVAGTERGSCWNRSSAQSAGVGTRSWAGTRRRR